MIQHKNKAGILTIFIALFFALGANEAFAAKKPTVYTIGDSTVKNGQGDGYGGLWGWGDPIRQFLDLEKINHENYARGGTSSRTFRSLGLWKPVLDKLQKGDFVLIQFGHNDAGPLNDDSRARGTIKGIGNESEEIDNLLTGEHETVHTYGWYLTQYIKEIKKRKAIPVIISSIPRNKWEEGLVPRNNNAYGLWAKQVAQKEKVLFIDLNEKMAAAMEKLGESNVTENLFWSHDHTHPSAPGAVLAASLVIEGLKENPKFKLNRYLLANPVINFPVKRKIFLIGDSTVATGNDSIAGWGGQLVHFIDTTRATIINKARGGRSSRTFMQEGLWAEIENQLGEGDFLLIQFGHNDGAPIDKDKFRGSIKGSGNESETVTHPDGKTEIVNSFGWYLKKYAADAKAKGAIPILLSHVPRNRWTTGKVDRCDQSYGLWTKEAAEASNVLFLDLNELIAEHYEKIGFDNVQTFFTIDHTHTNTVGALLNATILANELKNNRNCPIRAYIDIPK